MYSRTTNFDKALNRSVTTPLEVCNKAGPTAYYWYHKTLEIASDINERTGLNWKLTLSLLAAWVLVTGCMIKGIKSTGKVSLFRYLFSVSYTAGKIFVKSGTVTPIPHSFKMRNAIKFYLRFERYSK